MASPRLIPLSAHVSPATPACSERALSATVVTTALKTAVTSSVPAAAAARVRAEPAAGSVAAAAGLRTVTGAAVVPGGISVMDIANFI